MLKIQKNFTSSFIIFAPTRKHDAGQNPVPFYFAVSYVSAYIKYHEWLGLAVWNQTEQMKILESFSEKHHISTMQLNARGCII